jgi:hypothetical protein
MSSYHDDEFEQEESGVDYDDEGETEIEEYEPSEEEREVEDEQEFAAPTIYAGKEQLRTWNPDAAGGIKSTMAEGVLGKQQAHLVRSARTPEERFRDSLEQVASAKNAQIDSGTVKAVIQLIPKIPDIQYKSPAGCLLGYMFLPYLGKTLNPSQKSAADKIIDKTKLIRDKKLQIFPLDVVRYARAWNLWRGAVPNK